MVETQFDLQEAISYAITQKSSLRLIVDNTGTSAETKPTAEPTPVQATSTRTPLPDMQSVVGRGCEKLISTAKIAQSALASSKTLQAIQEDACSIRGFIEARVERNRSIKFLVGIVARGVLLWGVFFGPSFWLLLNILIGTLLTPRNALTDRAREQIRILFGLLALRTVMGFLFGLTCCLTPVLLACGLGAYIFTKRNRCDFNRIFTKRHRKGRHLKHRQRTSNDRCSSSTSQQEHKDIQTLLGIFPAMTIGELKQAYMRHKDVQNTVLELSERKFQL